MIILSFLFYLSFTAQMQIMRKVKLVEVETISEKTDIKFTLTPLREHLVSTHLASGPTIASSRGMKTLAREQPCQKWFYLP